MCIKEEFDISHTGSRIRSRERRSELTRQRQVQNRPRYATPIRNRDSRRGARSVIRPTRMSRRRERRDRPLSRDRHLGRRDRPLNRDSHIGRCIEERALRLSRIAAGVDLNAGVVKARWRPLLTRQREGRETSRESQSRIETDRPLLSTRQVPLLSNSREPKSRIETGPPLLSTRQVPLLNSSRETKRGRSIEPRGLV
jgi:hypothetical protein